MDAFKKVLPLLLLSLAFPHLPSSIPSLPLKLAHFSPPLSALPTCVVPLSLYTATHTHTHTHTYIYLLLIHPHIYIHTYTCTCCCCCCCCCCYACVLSPQMVLRAARIALAQFPIAGSCSVHLLTSPCSGACNAVRTYRLPAPLSHSPAQPSSVNSSQTRDQSIDRSSRPHRKEERKEEENALHSQRHTPPLPPLLAFQTLAPLAWPLPTRARNALKVRSVDSPSTASSFHPHTKSAKVQKCKSAKSTTTQPHPSQEADNTLQATGCDRPHLVWCTVLVPGWRSKISARRQTKTPALVSRVSLDSFASNPLRIPDALGFFCVFALPGAPWSTIHCLFQGSKVCAALGSALVLDQRSTTFVRPPFRSYRHSLLQRPSPLFPGSSCSSCSSFFHLFHPASNPASYRASFDSSSPSRRFY
ncbi:hypothetical protein V8C37DRAFT_200982 [Trichoderma ceciliae]